jgi:hypothetical protein
MEEVVGVHGSFNKIHCNLKSMLSFALSKLKPINQLVTTILIQLKSPNVKYHFPLTKGESRGTEQGTDLTVAHSPLFDSRICHSRRGL